MLDCTSAPKAVFLGFGSATLPGEYIDKRCRAAAEAIDAAGVELIFMPPVSEVKNDAQIEIVMKSLESKDYDCVIACISSWMPRWAMMNMFRRFKSTPILLLGLSGDQTEGYYVSSGAQAVAADLNQVMRDAGFRFLYLAGRRGRKLPTADIYDFCVAAKAVKQLKKTRIGMAGFRDMRLYGRNQTIPVNDKIGVEIEYFDIEDLKKSNRKLAPSEVKKLVEELPRRWHFKNTPCPETLEKVVKTYFAIRNKVEKCGFDGFSFVNNDSIKKHMGYAPAGALTLLHDEKKISTIPENDVLGATTQAMVRLLTGQVGAYFEIYDFLENGIMLAVPDYVPSEVVEGRVTVIDNSVDGVGEGIINVSKVKNGPATLCRLGCCGGELKMHISTGDAERPVRWHEVGWPPPAPQMPSLDFILSENTDEFVQNVAGMHYIIAYGDHRRKIEFLCRLLDIDCS
ncbi:hypothetical protein P0136_11875 [Lentisphaerota bacterium ZTH]|nr:hypothetical protein JYG24_10610 [Lentisphaerota bacterium]WET06055.1 hypothetical protein P0136_11875 [Lentisphaerota bacterium ZTH]